MFEEPDFATELIPAFLSGGAFILLVAIGAAWMVQKQMSGWSREEQVTAIRGLRATGYVGLAFAIPLTVAAAMMASRYGVSTYALPASVVISGAIFLVGARRLDDGQKL